MYCSRMQVIDGSLYLIDYRAVFFDRHTLTRTRTRTLPVTLTLTLSVTLTPPPTPRPSPVPSRHYAPSRVMPLLETLRRNPTLPDLDIVVAGNDAPSSNRDPDPDLHH